MSSNAQPAAIGRFVRLILVTVLVAALALLGGCGWLGIPGVILAALLTVVAYVAVRKLYVQGALGKGPDPGGRADGGAAPR